jgi:hypothetical protein
MCLLIHHHNIQPQLLIRLVKLNLPRRAGRVVHRKWVGQVTFTAHKSKATVF